MKTTTKSAHYGARAATLEFLHEMTTLALLLLCCLLCIPTLTIKAVKWKAERADSRQVDGAVTAPIAHTQMCLYVHMSSPALCS